MWQTFELPARAWEDAALRASVTKTSATGIAVGILPKLHLSDNAPDSLSEASQSAAGAAAQPRSLALGDCTL